MHFNYHILKEYLKKEKQNKTKQNKNKKNHTYNRNNLCLIIMVRYISVQHFEYFLFTQYKYLPLPEVVSSKYAQP